MEQSLVLLTHLAILCGGHLFNQMILWLRGPVEQAPTFLTQYVPSMDILDMLVELKVTFLNNLYLLLAHVFFLFQMMYMLHILMFF